MADFDVARLEGFLCCPGDGNGFVAREGVSRCPECGRILSFGPGWVAIPGPASGPQRGSRLRIPMGPQEFGDTLVEMSRQLGSFPAVGELVADLAGRPGPIVDLATGPGGGMIPALARHLHPQGICVGTDVNPEMASGWGKVFAGSRMGSRFLMLAVDLEEGTPFRHGSVTAFVGVGVGNIVGLAGVLHRAAPCLAPGGIMAFLEWLVPEDSPSGRFQREQLPGGICTPEGYRAFASQAGFRLELSDPLMEARGKRNPGDVLPVGEDEVMSLHLVRLWPDATG